MNKLYLLLLMATSVHAGNGNDILLERIKTAKSTCQKNPAQLADCVVLKVQVTYAKSCPLDWNEPAKTCVPNEITILELYNKKQS